MVISGEDKKSHRASFSFNKKLENTTKIIYLGIKINSVGSLKSTITYLSSRAERAIFSWDFSPNNRYKLSKLLTKVAIKLFHSCIYPFLTYRVEV